MSYTTIGPIVTTRESPIKVAKREFEIEPTEPYYFVRYGGVRSDQKLRTYLDAETRRYDPDKFPGMLYAPAFMETVFLFLNNGRLVDLTNTSVETAHQAFETLFEHFEAIGAVTTSPELEVRKVTRDVLSTSSNESQDSDSSSDDIGLSLNFENIREQLVAVPLFEPRDRLHFPQSDLTIRLPSDDAPGSTQYIYHETSGTLDLETPPEGDVFLGLDSEHEIGFLFTPEDLLAVFDHHGGGPIQTDWADNNAVIVSSFRDVSSTTIHVFAADGTLTYNTEESGVNDIAISADGQVVAYTHGRKPPVLTICQFGADGTVSTVELEGYARVKYADDTAEFFVGSTSDGVFTRALSLDGAINRELSPDESKTRVERFLSQRGNVSLHEVMLQVQQNPSECVGAIPDLLDMLTSDEFPPQERYSVPEIFRTLAREQPPAFEYHLDTLCSLLQKPTAPYQAKSADKVIRELYAADIQRDSIVERVFQLLKQNTERETERAIRLLGTRTLDLTTYEETLDLLIEFLDEEMEPQLMLPTVDALSNSTLAKKENLVLSKLATKDRVGTLVTLLRFGHDRRARDENALSMSISIETSTEADGQPYSERETELDADDLYHLNERVAGQLRVLARVYPNTVTPHLGRILLDLKTEAESLENVRTNALKIVEELLDADPESLSPAVERHRATIRELVQHPKVQIGEAALQLLSRSSVEQDNETLQEIASTPSHKHWQTARTLVESETSDQRRADDFGDTVADEYDRLKHLPTDELPPLHLPTPDEIRDYRTTAGLERAEVSGAVGYHHSYLKALEEGLLNPPLSVLVEITVRVAPDDALINGFPTGARIHLRRITADYSSATLSDKAGLSNSRLQAIEDGTVEPQAHEAEQLLIAIGDAEEPAAYPDKPQLREAWIKYGTALALELGRLPKSSELAEYPDASGDGSVPNLELGFNGDEEVSIDVEMPKPPHWAVFDSWDELLEELEVDNAYRTSGAPLRSSLLVDLKNVAEQVSGQPTTTVIDEHSEYSYHYYKKEFGGIQAAREAAGLE